MDVFLSGLVQCFIVFFRKRGVLRKEKKSPVSGWKSIFSKGRSQSLKQKEPKGSLPGL